MTFLKECYEWKRVILRSFTFFCFLYSLSLSLSPVLFICTLLSTYLRTTFFAHRYEERNVRLFLRLSYINLSFHTKFSNIFDASSISLSIIISLSLFSRNPRKLELLVQFYITNTAGTNVYQRVRIICNCGIRTA